MGAKGGGGASVSRSVDCRAACGLSETELCGGRVEERAEKRSRACTHTKNNF